MMATVRAAYGSRANDDDEGDDVLPPLILLQNELMLITAAAVAAALGVVLKVGIAAAMLVSVVVVVMVLVAASAAVVVAVALPIMAMQAEGRRAGAWCSPAELPGCLGTKPLCVAPVATIMTISMVRAILGYKNIAKAILEDPGWQFS